MDGRIREAMNVVKSNFNCLYNTIGFHNSFLTSKKLLSDYFTIENLIYFPVRIRKDSMKFKNEFRIPL